MQPTLTRIGAVLVAATLASGAAFAAGQATSSGSASPDKSRQQGQGETQTLEGRIVTLYEYLSPGGDASALNQSGSAQSGSAQPSRASSLPRSGSSIQSDSTSAAGVGTPRPSDADRNRGNTPGNQSIDQTPRPDRSIRSDVNTDASAAGSNADRPIVGNDASSRSQDSSRAGTTTSRDFAGSTGESMNGTSANQPLILIVQGTSASAASATNGAPGALGALPQGRTATTEPARYPTQRELLEQGQARDRTQATLSQSGAASHNSGNSEAYILVFNPQNHASRQALSEAQSMISQHGRGTTGFSVSDNETPASDRLPVRGTAEDSNGTDAAKSDNWSKSHDMKNGSNLKVTGKILSRGGLQAIEVMSIEKSKQPAAR